MTRGQHNEVGLAIHCRLDCLGFKRWWVREIFSSTPN